MHGKMQTPGLGYMDATTEQKAILPGPERPDSELAEDAAWCQQVSDRIGAGDSAAEALLLERLKPGLRVVLMSRCTDRELISDLCQDTLIIVLNRLRSRTLDDPTRVAAFAAQTARQLAFDARRRAAVRRTSVDSPAIDAAPLEATTDHSVEQASISSLVRQLLTELSGDRDREILRRFYLLEQEKAEICRSLSLAPGTFDQLIFRARARLKVLLELRGLASRDLFCFLMPWIPKAWLR
jgi:RNA polymerase sigma-70 factor, ECF subfamily